MLLLLFKYNLGSDNFELFSAKHSSLLEFFHPQPPFLVKLLGMHLLPDHSMPLHALQELQ